MTFIECWKYFYSSTALQNKFEYFHFMLLCTFLLFISRQCWKVTKSIYSSTILTLHFHAVLYFDSTKDK